jgi:hypothetical protein
LIVDPSPGPEERSRRSLQIFETFAAIHSEHTELNEPTEVQVALIGS